MGVLVICVLCLLGFVLVVQCFCIVYVYLFLFVLSVLVYGLLPPTDISIAVVVTKLTPDSKATTRSRCELGNILEKRRMLRNSPQSLSF